MIYTQSWNSVFSLETEALTDWFVL